LKAYVRLIVLYLSISMSFLTTWAFQKHSWPQQLTLCQSLHTETLQATASEGLAQGPYVWLERDLNPRPSSPKAAMLSMRRVVNATLKK